jgi:hypothetical protein
MKPCSSAEKGLNIDSTEADALLMICPAFNGGSIGGDLRPCFGVHSVGLDQWKKLQLKMIQLKFYFSIFFNFFSIFFIFSQFFYYYKFFLLL